MTNAIRMAQTALCLPMQLEKGVAGAKKAFFVAQFVARKSYH